MTSSEAKFRDYQRAYLEQQGLRFRSTRLAVPDVGYTVEALEAGEGEPLLLLHGGGGLADDWAPLAARLQDRFRLIMPYLPGHGPSGAFDFTGVDLRRFSSQFLRAVTQSLGLGTTGIVANSIGGYWALAYAVDHPTDVNHLVLAGAPAGFETRVPSYFRMMTMPGLGPLMGRMSRFFSCGKVRQMLGGFVVARTDSLPEAYTDLAWAALRLPGAGESYRSMMRSFNGKMRDIRIEAAHVGAPLLFLWGEKDCFGPPTQAEALCASRENASVERIPGAGHFPWFDEPDRVARLTADFLTEQR